MPGRANRKGTVGEPSLSALIERCRGGDERARRRDRATADAILALDDARVGPGDACGCHAIAGLLTVARRRRLAPRVLDLRNSGDTAGGRREVVGYGAFAFTEPDGT